MKKASLFYYIFSFILLIVFIFLIINAYNNLSTSASTIAPVNNKYTIIIDAGHGGEDGGAVANNLTEKDINLEISKILSDIFVSNGYKVVMTRSNDNSIESSGTTLRERKVSDMKNRLEIYNSDENNIVISIHQNKFEIEKYSGTQIFYSPNNEKSSVLAESIRTSVIGLIQPENTRECKKATKDIYLLYNSKVPSIIVECGFLSNNAEAQKLSTETYQKQMAYSIYLGIVNYLNN